LPITHTCNNRYTFLFTNPEICKNTWENSIPQGLGLGPFSCLL
jgi:hypothetical protein